MFSDIQVLVCLLRFIFELAKNYDDTSFRKRVEGEALQDRVSYRKLLFGEFLFAGEFTNFHFYSDP